MYSAVIFEPHCFFFLVFFSLNLTIYKIVDVSIKHATRH